MIIGTVLVMMAALMSASVASAQNGEALFKTCAACHRIGGGRLVGPDLANVDKRRPEEWLLRFIKSPQSVMAGGDQYALNLKQQFGGIVMPDNNLSPGEIKALIAYIVSKSPGREEKAAEPAPVAASEPANGDTAVAGNDGGAVQAVAEQSAPDDPEIGGRRLSAATVEDVRAGGQLFAGYQRFEHGGPSCISCHTVRNDNLTTGGALAKDLSGAFGRLQGSGLASVMSGLPFPAMQDAFGGTPLTDREIYSLVAFLKYSNEIEPTQAGFNYGLRLFMVGCIGAVCMLAFFSALWFRRKKRTVHDAMFRRQVQSTHSS